MKEQHATRNTFLLSASVPRHRTLTSRSMMRLSIYCISNASWVMRWACPNTSVRSSNVNSLGETMIGILLPETREKYNEMPAPAVCLGWGFLVFAWFACSHQVTVLWNLCRECRKANGFTTFSFPDAGKAVLDDLSRLTSPVLCVKGAFVHRVKAFFHHTKIVSMCSGMTHADSELAK